jgi:hypothetical protein
MALTTIIPNQGQTPTQGVPPTLNGKNVRDQIADAFTFIRSMESNQAISTVTLEELITDQINRNGDSKTTNATQYDPYSYDPTSVKVPPASLTPQDPANFLGVADTGAVSKMSRIAALRNGIEVLVEGLKNIDPLALMDSTEYTPTASDGIGLEVPV